MLYVAFWCLVDAKRIDWNQKLQFTGTIKFSLALHPETTEIERLSFLNPR